MAYGGFIFKQFNDLPDEEYSSKLPVNIFLKLSLHIFCYVF